MDLKTLSETISNFATSAAVLVGGGWAYVKFVKGRTFKHRAALAVSSEIKEVAGARFLSVTVTLRNEGLSKLPLNSKMKALKLFALPTSANPRIEPAPWKRIRTFPLFEQHEWLEPLEPVSDDLLFVLPSAEAVTIAYRVEAVVGSKASLITRKKTRWWAGHVLILSAAGDTTGAGGVTVPPAAGDTAGAGA